MKIKKKMLIICAILMLIILSISNVCNAWGALLIDYKSYANLVNSSSYIMSDAGLKYLQDNMGQFFTPDGTAILTEVQIWSDNLAGVMPHPWVHCSHPTTPMGNATLFAWRLFSVLEVGADKQHSNELTNYAFNKNQALLTEELGYNDNAGLLACWALISNNNINPYDAAYKSKYLLQYKGSDSSIAEDTQNFIWYAAQSSGATNTTFDINLGKLWSNCFRASATNRNNYPYEFTLTGFGAYEDDPYTMPTQAMREFRLNCAYYQYFVDQVLSGDGKAIEVNPDLFKDTLKIDGDTVKGVVFSKFANDENRDYTGEFNAFAPIDPNYQVKVEATLKDGTKVTSGIVITDASGKTVESNNMRAGTAYNFKVPGSSKTNPVTKIKMTASYELIHARVACMMLNGAGEGDQSRTFTGAEKKKYTDEIEFEVTEPRDPVNIPVIVIKKTDPSGSALDNAVFSAKIVNKTTKQQTTISGLKTNEAGEVTITSDQLADIGIEEIYGNDMLQPNQVGKIIGSANLEITLTETTPPDGYKKLDGNVVVDAIYSSGKLQIAAKNGVAASNKISYLVYDSNNTEKKVTSDVGVITVKNTPNATLKVRKVDGDTEKQDFLTGARFTVDITANGKAQSVTQTVDGKGYIDITSAVNQCVTDIGKYSGDVKVTLNELTNPNSYIKINNKITVTLTYANGKITKITYPNNDNLSRDIIDVGESEDGNDVTIAVKNTKTGLQPIYISKVDSNTGVMLSNVDFNIIVSTTQITNKTNSKAYKTSDDGLIRVGEDVLKEIGLTDNYSGELYLLAEETVPKAGYKKLTDDVYLKVTYTNGNVQSAEIINGANATATTTSVNGAGMVVVSVRNEKVLPDLVIQKETFSNNVTEIVNSANLSIIVTASNGKGFRKKATVNKSGNITITGDELATLGINGTYTGNLIVEIAESSVEAGVAVLPEKVTATVSLINGRFKEGTVTNNAHLSIIDNETSIMLKVLDYKKEITYMKISGIVWEELATTKAAGTLIDGLYTKASDSEYSDKLFEGVEVTLYKVNGNNLEFVNVTKGTNPTYTDANGAYQFSVPDDNTKYVVKFTYNGQGYQAAGSTEYDPTKALSNWKLSSKASELTGNENTAGTRTYVNSLLNEIGSYPANYKMKTDLFDKSVINEDNNRSKAYDAGYNIAYTVEELGELHREIADAMREQLIKSQNINVETANGLKTLVNIYAKVAAKHSDDKEIYNKLQYIYDTRVSAYAGYSTNKNGISSTSGLKSYPHTSDKTIDHEYQQYVNLGIVKRDKTDLTVLKDVYQAIISAKGYDTTYNFNKGNSSNTQYVYQEDFRPTTGANSDGTVWYTGDNFSMDVYVKYKITITNTSNTATAVKEVVDYFDYRFGFNDSYTTTAKKTLAGVEAKKIAKNGSASNITNVKANTSSKYIAVTQIGLTGVSNYLPVYISFDNDTNITDGEKIEIYLTFKLGRDDTNKIKSTYQSGIRTVKELLNEFITGPSTLLANNYAEVNGYKTSGGFIDADSRPGSFKVKEYENAKAAYLTAYNNRNSNKAGFIEAMKNLTTVREDDAWTVELSFAENDDKRKLTGNVWEAISGDVKVAADLQSKAALKYGGNNNIEGIIVELLELEEGTGKQIVRGRTITAANGSYEFKGFHPGEYVIRFIYGAVNRAGYSTAQITKIASASATYNGTKYQSTKANANTSTDNYWFENDIGTRYSDAYDSAYSRASGAGGALEYDYTVALNQASATEIVAYTSSIAVKTERESKVSSTGKTLQGGANQSYAITNVDFGLTPRTNDSIDIEKYISNVKVYLQNGAKQLDVDIDENGKVTFLNDATYANVVGVFSKRNGYTPDALGARKDGFVTISLDEQLLNGATLEISYTIKATNNSVKETIKYFYSTSKGNTPVAMAYYGEAYNKLPYFEARKDNSIVYHDESVGTYSLEKYSSEKAIESETSIRELIDYVDPSLTFIRRNKAGDTVNSDWEMTGLDTFNSSRKTNATLIGQYNTFLKPTEENALRKTIATGQTVSTKLTLSRVLSTSSSQTNDWEYSNLIEITKLYNTAGKPIVIRGYDITGKDRPETSQIVPKTDIKDNIYPTLGTAKSETVVIHAPTGQSAIEKVLSNVVIVLVAVSILAGGIVLIKKFVLNKN